MSHSGQEPEGNQENGVSPKLVLSGVTRSLFNDNKRKVIDILKINSVFLTEVSSFCAAAFASAI